MRRVENVGEDTRLHAGQAFGKDDDESSFAPLSASSISSESTSFQSLIAMHLDRILYLTSFKLANCVFVYQAKNVALSYRSALRKLECLMQTKLSKEYFVNAADVVQRLDHFRLVKCYAPLSERKVFLLDENISAYLGWCDAWFDLLILEMQQISGLGITGKKDFEFKKSAENAEDVVED